MRAFVGVTDWDWYRLLHEAVPLEEVNFWQPGGKHRFTVLQPGEMFLFKLHSPRNFIVGGGAFAHSTILPMSLAWESFGLSNGAHSFVAMRARIERYRKARPDPLDDYSIGCILLEQPFFLPESDWIPIPADWAPNIVQGKRYDLNTEPGASILQRLLPFLSPELSGTGAAALALDRDVDEPDRYGAPILVTPRLGQGTFRVMVTDAYERRCAITGEKVLPVLEAAHIRPFSQSGPHRVENGVLLRSDLHTLFDRGYLTLTPELHLEVSDRLRADFENGRDYFALHGRSLRTPIDSSVSPDREYLVWHNENVFKG